MSRTHNHKKAQKQRATGTMFEDNTFDGARYGNKRKAMARLKVQERRDDRRARKASGEQYWVRGVVN